MTYWDGRDPSGKAIACSMLAIILVLGAPAFLLYTDSQGGINVDSLIEEDFATQGSYPRLSAVGATDGVNFTSLTTDKFSDFVPEDGDGRLLSVDLSGDTLYKGLHFTYVIQHITQPISAVKYTLSDAPAVSAVEFRYKMLESQDVLCTVKLEQGITGLWSANLSPYETSLTKDADLVIVAVTFEEAQNTALEFGHSIEHYEDRNIVTVNTVLIAAGLVLIFGAIYATPYVAIGDVSKGLEKGARGAYRSGKKIVRRK